MNKRHRFVQDESSHWYIIPADKHSEFEEWLELGEDDPVAWTPPEWAYMLNMHISSVSFGEYRID